MPAFDNTSNELVAAAAAVAAADSLLALRQQAAVGAARGLLALQQQAPVGAEMGAARGLLALQQQAPVGAEMEAEMEAEAEVEAEVEGEADSLLALRQATIANRVRDWVKMSRDRVAAQKLVVADPPERVALAAQQRVAKTDDAAAAARAARANYMNFGAKTDEDNVNQIISSFYFDQENSINELLLHLYQNCDPVKKHLDRVGLTSKSFQDQVFEDFQHVYQRRVLDDRFQKVYRYILISQYYSIIMDAIDISHDTETCKIARSALNYYRKMGGNYFESIAQRLENVISKISTGGEKGAEKFDPKKAHNVIPGLLKEFIAELSKIGYIMPGTNYTESVLQEAGPCHPIFVEMIKNLTEPNPGPLWWDNESGSQGVIERLLKHNKMSIDNIKKCERPSATRIIPESIDPCTKYTSDMMCRQLSFRCGLFEININVGMDGESDGGPKRTFLDEGETLSDKRRHRLYYLIKDPKTNIEYVFSIPVGKSIDLNQVLMILNGHWDINSNSKKSVDKGTAASLNYRLPKDKSEEEFLKGKECEIRYHGIYKGADFFTAPKELDATVPKAENLIDITNHGHRYMLSALKTGLDKRILWASLFYDKDMLGWITCDYFVLPVMQMIGLSQNGGPDNGVLTKELLKMMAAVAGEKKSATIGAAAAAAVVPALAAAVAPALAAAAALEAAATDGSFVTKVSSVPGGKYPLGVPVGFPSTKVKNYVTVWEYGAQGDTNFPQQFLLYLGLEHALLDKSFIAALDYYITARPASSSRSVPRPEPLEGPPLVRWMESPAPPALLDSIKITITDQLRNQIIYIKAMEIKFANINIKMTIFEKLEYIEMIERVEQACEQLNDFFELIASIRGAWKALTEWGPAEAEVLIGEINKLSKSFINFKMITPFEGATTLYIPLKSKPQTTDLSELVEKTSFNKLLNPSQKIELKKAMTKSIFAMSIFNVDNIGEKYLHKLDQWEAAESAAVEAAESAAVEAAEAAAAAAEAAEEDDDEEEDEEEEVEEDDDEEEDEEEEVEEEEEEEEVEERKQINTLIQTIGEYEVKTDQKNYPKEIITKLLNAEEIDSSDNELMLWKVAFGNDKRLLILPKDSIDPFIDNYINLLKLGAAKPLSDLATNVRKQLDYVYKVVEPPPPPTPATANVAPQFPTTVRPPPPRPTELSSVVSDLLVKIAIGGGSVEEAAATTVATPPPMSIAEYFLSHNTIQEDIIMDNVGTKTRLYDDKSLNLKKFIPMPYPSNRNGSSRSVPPPDSLPVAQVGLELPLIKGNKKTQQVLGDIVAAAEDSYFIKIKYDINSDNTNQRNLFRTAKQMRKQQIAEYYDHHDESTQQYITNIFVSEMESVGTILFPAELEFLIELYIVVVDVEGARACENNIFDAIYNIYNPEQYKISKDKLKSILTEPDKPITVRNLVQEDARSDDDDETMSGAVVEQPTSLPSPALTSQPIAAPTGTPVPLPTTQPTGMPLPAPTSMPLPAPTSMPIVSPPLPLPPPRDDMRSPATETPSDDEMTTTLLPTDVPPPPPSRKRPYSISGSPTPRRSQRRVGGGKKTRKNKKVKKPKFTKKKGKKQNKKNTKVKRQKKLRRKAKKTKRNYCN